MVRRIIIWLSRYIDTLIAGMALAIILYTLAQEMIARWFFNASFLWTEDLSRVLLVILVYFGAAAVTGEDRNIRVEFVQALLPEGARRVLNFFIDLACLAFALAATWLGVMLTRGTMTLGLTFAHSGLPLPIWVAHASIPVAFGLMSIRILVRMIWPPPRKTDEELAEEAI